MTAKSAASCQTLRTIPIAKFEMNAPAFESSHPLYSSTLDCETITDLEMNSYHIALVPFSPLAEGDPVQNGIMEKLLLLPLTWNQLIGRVRKEIDRTSSATERHVVEFGHICIDFLAMDVRRSERPVSLTAMEFKVLRFFVSNPNRVISRDELLNQVWGYANYPCTRTVDNHVLKLRQKLEVEITHPVHFRTVHGIGYKFVP
jgi:DNA-binding winged helix-turn-helix (wHTH) protein